MQEDGAVGYEHMGAVLTEAVLQAGIKYDTVVAPRVQDVLARYPEARTTSGFARVLMLEGAPRLLNWKLDRKMRTLADVTLFLLGEQVETVEELRAWVSAPANVARLKRIKGIGPKSADYFKILCGISTSAIDVHLYRFLAQAGVAVKGYDEAQAVIRETAVLLGVEERVLDYSIWVYMAR